MVVSFSNITYFIFPAVITLPFTVIFLLYVCNATVGLAAAILSSKLVVLGSYTFVQVTLAYSNVTDSPPSITELILINLPPNSIISPDTKYPVRV